MRPDPDLDWYLDHVLVHAEPGSSATIRVDDVTRWEAWWLAQARAVRAAWPELAGPALGHGFVLTTDRLSAAGISRGVARGHVRRGLWGVPAASTVALVGPAALAADDPDRWTLGRRRHALHACALAATNADHYVSGSSSAVLHGLPVFALPDEPELSVPAPGRTRRRGARVATVSPDEVTRWFGTPLASLSRTVVDVARAGRRDGIVLADAALRCRRVTRAQLAVAVQRADGWPGVRQAREIVALADPRAESPLESVLRLAIHDAGLPAPELQVAFPVPGRREPFRVDLCWPAQRLIVEADGRVKYSAARDDKPDDDPLWTEKKRELALRRLGFRVERVIWSDVVAHWPATRQLLADALGC